MFFHPLGASRLQRNICDTAAEEAWLATTGTCVGSDLEGLEDSDLAILWGINQLTSRRLTDLGSCSTLHENLVNVERAAAIPGA